MIAMQEIKRKQLLARKWHALIEEDARRVQEAKLGALPPTGEMDRAMDKLRSMIHPLRSTESDNEGTKAFEEPDKLRAIKEQLRQAATGCDEE